MSPRTRYEYGRLQALFEAFRGGPGPEALAQVAQRWLQTLSPSRQRVARAALRQRFGDDAGDWRALRVSRYRRNEARLVVSVLGGQARAHLATTLRDDRERALIACLYTLRRAEVAALRWADIDLAPGVAVVLNGKGGKASWTLLTASAQTALAAWFEAAGAPPDPSPVFPNRDGAHYTPGSIGELVRGLLERAGLWKPGSGCAHRFRRSFATEYLRANPGDLEGLRRLMRHDAIATTIRYVYLEPEDLAPRLARVRL